MTTAATTAYAQNAAEPVAPVAPVASPDPAADPSRSYEEFEATARRLAAAIGMPPERQTVALGRLRTAFQSGKVAAFAGNLGINGVFAYQMGEGGFLVKIKRGKVPESAAELEHVPAMFRPGHRAYQSALAHV